jgi:hypothetical protein
VLRLKEWVNKDDKDSRQRERQNRRDYIYIYKANKMGDIRFVKINGRYIPPKIIVNSDMYVTGLRRTLCWLGRDSWVSIAVCFGLDGPGIESC